MGSNPIARSNRITLLEDGEYGRTQDSDRRSHLQEAIRSFLQSGGTAQEIFEVVTTATREDHHTSNGDYERTGGAVGYQPNPHEFDGFVRVYESAPPHLMTVLEAAQKYSMTPAAIYQWIKSGRIAEAGFLRGGSGKQRNVTLIDREEFATLASGPDQLPFYDELPEGLITVSEACKKYRRSPRTLRRWWSNGYIRLMGRLRAPARGGGYLVVSTDEIEAHIADPPYKIGRPPNM